MPSGFIRFVRAGTCPGIAASFCTRLDSVSPMHHRPVLARYLCAATRHDRMKRTPTPKSSAPH